MKSILLYAHDDNGMESRLQAALDIARMNNGHVECVTVQPLTALMMSDPFGASFIIPAAMEAIENQTEAAQARMAARMGSEDVSWSLSEGDGDAAEILTSRARLADLVLLSLGESNGGSAAPHMVIGDVVMNSNVPVFAVPYGHNRVRFDGNVVVAWNGTDQAANAMRAAVPLLVGAGAVHIVTIDEDGMAYPATEAAAYLSRHGIKAEVHQEAAGGRSVPEALLAIVGQLNADWMVMGAYGHGRLREMLFGGVTRDFLGNSRIPVFVTH